VYNKREVILSFIVFSVKKYMALSLFSQKESSEHSSPTQASEGVVEIRTMKGDLENIKNGGSKSSQPEAETPTYKSVSPSFSPGSSPLAVNPFSEEGEKLFEPQEKKTEVFQVPVQANPFGVAPSPPQKSPAPFIAAQSMMKNGLNSAVPEGGLLINQQSSNKKKMTSIVIFGTALLLFALGGAWYFFLKSDTNGSLESGSVSGVVEKSSDAQKNASPKQHPFSLDKPNYLSFNVETVSPSEFQKTLAQTAERIKAADIKEPIEFLVTDQSNNPLAFSRFAFLLKLELDSKLLALTNESFSLYVYNDGGQVHLGLAVSFSDPQAAALLIAKTESSLPYALRTLILEPNINVGKSLGFRSTTYNQFAIRFANINSEKNLSLDYSLDKAQLFIGTSKNTLRIILDANTK
jgi:hypothetical protein